MGAITLQDLDESLVARIAALAEANQHSLEQEVASLVAAGLREHERRVELIERLERIAAMTPKGVPQTDSALLVREDRDR
ncbi:MAG TPA: hypothetical protein VEA41_00975 [Salinarimonas sp.]|nr:hypothetical protein [Salinarimonas sp.]